MACGRVRVQNLSASYSEMYYKKTSLKRACCRADFPLRSKAATNAGVIFKDKPE